ncbi:asr4612 [Nostoc sp. PCC 7120 = FACHB-418]|nr:asr4612 [Nostoc sp. PCC 7120 = FACHB-418]
MIQPRHNKTFNPVTSHQSPVTSHQSPVTSPQSPVPSPQSPAIAFLCVEKEKTQST